MDRKEYTKKCLEVGRKMKTMREAGYTTEQIAEAFGIKKEHYEELDEIIRKYDEIQLHMKAANSKEES